jgi:hypothetical protein
MKTSGGPRREKANARLERRHCEERSDEAIHSFFAWRDGLLPPSLFELRRTSRCARNDVDKSMPPPAVIARLDRAILVALSRLRQGFAEASVHWRAEAFAEAASRATTAGKPFED